jgi:hypothetical protein
VYCLYSFQLLQPEVDKISEAFANRMDSPQGLRTWEAVSPSTLYELTRQGKLLLEDMNHENLTLNITRNDFGMRAIPNIQ